MTFERSPILSGNDTPQAERVRGGYVSGCSLLIVSCKHFRNYSRKVLGYLLLVNIKDSFRLREFEAEDASRRYNLVGHKTRPLTHSA